MEVKSRVSEPGREERSSSRGDGPKRELKSKKGEENIHVGGWPVRGVSLTWGDEVIYSGGGIETAMEDRLHAGDLISKYMRNRGSQVFHCGERSHSMEKEKSRMNPVVLV